jgi:hypothetical protein
MRTRIPLAALALTLLGCNPKDPEFFAILDSYNSRVTGTVLVDGNPAAGMAICVTTTGTGTDQCVTTDANGHYVVNFVKTGSHSVFITPPTGKECPQPAVEVSVDAGASATANFSCGTPFALTVQTGYNHTIPGVESVECKRIVTTPAMPGATYTLQPVGPIEGGNSGIIAGQSFGGLLGQDGTVRVQVRINRFGTYRNTITVTGPGGAVIRTTTANVTVSSPANSCP